MRLIAFDFDGVFIDSVYECYVVALKAFERMGFRLGDSKTLYETVLKARTFVLSAEDFWPILNSVREDMRVDFYRIELDDFKWLREKYRKGTKEFTKHFYRTRKEIREENFKKWCGLHSFFTGVREAYKSLSQKYITLIATSKNMNATYLLLDNAGFRIRKDEITGREMSIHKTEQMKKISKIYKVPLEEIFFIEDMFETVKSVRKMGVNVALVEWGYSSPSQREEAESLGIPLIGKGNVLKQIEKLIQ